MAVAVVRPRLPGFTRGHGPLKYLMPYYAAAGKHTVSGLIKINAPFKIKLEPGLFNTKGTFTILQGYFWYGQPPLQVLVDAGNAPANMAQWILDNYVTIDATALTDVTLTTPKGVATTGADSITTVKITLL